MTFTSPWKNSWAALTADFNNLVVLTLLIRFHIWRRHKIFLNRRLAENNNLTETDPKSQRNNIFFVKSDLSEEVTRCDTYWNKLRWGKKKHQSSSLWGWKLNFLLWKFKFPPSTRSSPLPYLIFPVTVCVGCMLCYQNKSVQPFIWRHSHDIDLCLLHSSENVRGFFCRSLFFSFFSKSPVFWGLL